MNEDEGAQEKSDQVAKSSGGYESAPGGPPAKAADGEESEESATQTPERQLEEADQPLHSTHDKVSPRDEETS